MPGAHAPPAVVVGAARDLRQRGNAAFKEGRFQDALDCYCELLETQPHDYALLCNRAAAGLQLGAPLQSVRRESVTRRPVVCCARKALRDATAAVHVLSAEYEEVDSAWLHALAKGSCALRLGNARAACSYLHKAVTLAPGDALVIKLLQTAVHQLRSTEIAALAAEMIHDGEANAALSTRDGKFMKRLPEGSRFTSCGLAQHLEDALIGHEYIARHSLHTHFSLASNTAHGLHFRHLLHAFRCLALLQARCAALAMKDAAVAISFMPPHGCSLCLLAHALSAEAVALEIKSGTTDIHAGGRAVAVPLLTAAAMSWQRASRLVPDSTACEADFQRSLHLIPEVHARLLVEKGADALLERVQQQRDAALPEFMRPKPKYAAYFAWMTERLAARFPLLDEVSRDKLLCMDSGELDLLLQPQNAHLDAAVLVQAAENGLDFRMFQTLGQAPMHLLAS